MIGEVLSQVFDDVQVFRDVVYEWEDELAKHFGVPVRKIAIHSKPPKKNSV